MQIGGSAGNQGQDFLGEGDDNAARQRQEAVGALAGIMGLEGQTNLHDTPAQQDQAHRADHAKDKGTC